MEHGPDIFGIPLDLVEQVSACRACGDFLHEIQRAYDQVDGRISELGLRCLGGGACCKFDLAGHRLYLSTGELALLTQQARRVGQCRPLRCPYQVGPRCLAREVRPLGCRVFFCGRSKTSLLSSIYEESHRRIRQLHENHCLPYSYVEIAASCLQLSVDSRVR
jgi:Fe-S-cluster containining protein